MSLLATLPITLRQLQYIVAVADERGFRRAAEACHVSQPSLSAQVAQAEEALGLRIFERNPRLVRPSSAGAAMIEQARRVLIAAFELNEAARHLADPFRGTLRLGIIPTVGPYLLPDITPALATAFPRLTVTWTEERTATLVRDLQDGSIDAAVVALESNIGGLHYEKLRVDPFVLAAAPGHPLMNTGKPVPPRVLEGQQVLLLDDGHCLRDQALALCSRVGADEAGFHATSLGTLVQMVSVSSAVTLLPLVAVPVENRRGQLRVRAFLEPQPSRTLVLAWRRNSALSAPLTQVASVLRRTLGRRGRRYLRS
jgi:LysR family hydrogen peroxide-inducible transcriptional activator